MQFDWDMIRRPAWAPLSEFGLDADHVVRGLFAVAEGIYAMTSKYRGTEADPGVGAFLWARSRTVALVIYERQLDTGPEERPCPPPPSKVLGFAPPTYEAALAHEKGRDNGRPMLTFDYRFPDGRFCNSQLMCRERDYYFLQLKPEGDDSIAAIRFRLQEAHPVTVETRAEGASWSSPRELRLSPEQVYLRELGGRSDYQATIGRSGVATGKLLVAISGDRATLGLSDPDVGRPGAIYQFVANGESGGDPVVFMIGGQPSHIQPRYVLDLRTAQKVVQEWLTGSMESAFGFWEQQ